MPLIGLEYGPESKRQISRLRLQLFTILNGSILCAESFKGA